jgi:hypothetical protein
MNAMMKLVAMGIVVIMSSATLMVAMPQMTDSMAINGKGSSALDRMYVLTVSAYADGTENESALSPVDVCIYRAGGNETTVVLEKVARWSMNLTEQVSYELPEGRYLVSASSADLEGSSRLELSEDRDVTVHLHEPGEVTPMDPIIIGKLTIGSVSHPMAG